MSEILILRPDPEVDGGQVPGWIRTFAADKGPVDWELREVSLSAEGVPAFSDQVRGVVVLGGTMSAHSGDQNPWVADLAEFLRQAVAAEVPVLAICLGAQIAAEAFGGQCACPAEGQGEEGMVKYILRPGAKDDRWLGPALRSGSAKLAMRQAPRVPVSHDDAVVELPEGATLLAASEKCPNHTWRLGSLLAFQHHPEVTAQKLATWVAKTAFKAGKQAPQVAAIRQKALQEAQGFAQFNEDFGLALVGAFLSDC
ncbi:hypothetical protein BSR29_05145 [Boudabousia liubingyangii]|uniref:Glutamine amidotransferase domain-containing protein n=1 Tax=Boudabousia liubingyangii TaxID=1921764 RepID=A0A1Q5PLI4_9ACTO|nr:type 1 glutamine amidotransferase [Boudabousia liubingyangii]OKL47877.1 hypothetical protein BSR29_05145 [Boudabousia liubingyangii]